MNPNPNNYFITIIVIVATLSGVFSGCTPSQVTAPASPLPATVAPTHVNPPTATSIPTPIATSIPIPIITLKKGDFYFSIDGQQSFILSRNVAGYETSHYYQLLDLTSIGGSKFVRIQLDSLGMGYSNTGKVDESWAKKWEKVFDKAASNGIDIIPVFGVWPDWNNGNGFSTWKSNPFNEVNGGSVKTPVELFISDSPTQKLWLQWMKTLVERWQGQKNIIAWEIFSEVNMASGTTEPEAIDFVNSAASIIRNADPFHRPVTASLADFGEWNSFYQSDGIDFINIHPYPTSGKLDITIISEVRTMLLKYHKPVMIGESGLSFETPDSNPPTLTTADRADIGIKHAIWAAVVSGAMNGRALWWEDGVGIYFPALSWPFLKKYTNIELPAANFIKEVDFSGFNPLIAQFSAKITGAVVGNDKMMIGWFRDATCEPPDWNLQPVISGRSVTITVPVSAPNWQVDFYSTETGTDIVSSATVTRRGNNITITFPDFTDDIAFKLYPQSSAQQPLATSSTIPVAPTESPAPTAVIAPTTTDPIAGKWTGSIFGETSGFSALIDLSIQPGFKAGNVCGTVSVPQLPCSGSLALTEINGDTFVFIEQNMTGAAACASGGYEYLQLQENGTLSFKYTFTSSSGEKIGSSGVLKRP